MQLARKKGMIMADRLISIGTVDGFTLSKFNVWENIFRNLPKGINEIYCHPGYPDDTLRRFATYIEDREQELRILTRDNFKKVISQNEIELINFYQI